VLLVPVLVLGVLACGGFETDTEVDAYVQGLWAAVTGGDTLFTPITNVPSGIQLVVTPNEMTIRYEELGDVKSVPFNIQFSRMHRGRDGRFASDFFWTSGTDIAASWEDYDDVLTDSIAGYVGDARTSANIAKADFIGRLARNIDGVGFTTITYAGLDLDDDDDKVTLFDALITSLTAGHTATFTDHIIAGTLVMSDYRTGSELANVSVALYSNSDNNLTGTQSFAILGYRFADNVPWYMLDVPLKVALYRQ